MSSLKRLTFSSIFEPLSTKSREEEHLILSEIGDLQSKLHLNQDPKTFDDKDGFKVDNETDGNTVYNFHRLASRAELRDMFHSVPQEKLHQKFNHIVPENGTELIQGKIYDLKKKKDIIDYKKNTLNLKLKNLKHKLISGKKQFMREVDLQKISHIQSGIAKFGTKKAILQNLDYLYKTIIEKLQEDIKNYPLRLQHLDNEVKNNEQANKSLICKLKKAQMKANHNEKMLQNYKKGLKSTLRQKSVCFMHLKNKQSVKSDLQGEAMSRCSIRSAGSITSNYSRSLQSKIDSLNPEKRNQQTLLMQRNILSMCKEIAILQNQAVRLGQVAKVKVTDPEFQICLDATQKKSIELLKNKKKKEKTLKNLNEELTRLKLSCYDKTNEKILNTRKTMNLIKKKKRRQKIELVEKRDLYSYVSQIYENLIWKIFSISGINATIERSLFFDKFSEDPLKLIELIKEEYIDRYSDCTSINAVLDSVLRDLCKVEVYVDTEASFEKLNSINTELIIKVENLNEDFEDKSSFPSIFNLTIIKTLIHKHKKKNFMLHKVDKNEVMNFISNLDDGEKQQIICEVFLCLFKMEFIRMDFTNMRIVTSVGQLVSLEYLEQCKQISDSTTDDPSYLSAKDIKSISNNLQEYGHKK